MECRIIMNRNDVINYCLKLPNVYEDYPFPNDDTSVTMKHQKNNKWFALIMGVPFEKLNINKDGILDLINLKNIPEMIGELRKDECILPVDHMNKEHWISILLDGTVRKEKIL